MNPFSINPTYQNSVNSFNVLCVEEGDALILSNDAINEVVDEVSLQIISTSQMRHLFQQLAGRELSLQECAYHVTQSTDSHNRLNTASKIQESNEDVSKIVGIVIQKLSIDFEQLTQNDLKTLSLLFGIYKISQLAAQANLTTSSQSLGEKMEEMLDQLITKRNKYPKENHYPEAIQAFLDQVDKKIEEMQQLLTANK